MTSSESDSESESDKSTTSRGEQVREWLSHPLILLVVGAIVTGLLVPTITNRWQRNQTAQEMKTQTLAHITDAIAVPMTQLDVTQNPVFANGHNNPQATSATITGTYATFLSKSAKVGSEVNSYFPDNRIPIHWNDLVGLVHNFYLSTYATDTATRQSYIVGIKRYFDFHHINTGVDWGVLETGDAQSSTYHASWIKLEHQIIDVRNQLTASIMDAPSPSF